MCYRYRQYSTAPARYAEVGGGERECQGFFGCFVWGGQRGLGGGRVMGRRGVNIRTYLGLIIITNAPKPLLNYC